MNALVYVDIDQGIYKGELKNALNEKQKKTTWVFFYYKYGKFWSVLPDKKVDLKPLFSEECFTYLLPIDLQKGQVFPWTSQSAWYSHRQQLLDFCCQKEWYHMHGNISDATSKVLD